MGKFLVRDRMGFRQVPIQEVMTIGRSQTNDLVLNATFASRKHAWLWHQGEQAILEDLGSTHGTYLNGQLLTTARFLNYNDIVQIGEASLTFIADPDPSTAWTPKRGVPRPSPIQRRCTRCGAINTPQAAKCFHCGYNLQDTALASLSPGKTSQPAYPITPREPLIVQPFPTVSTQVRPRAGSTRVLIVLLAILAILLLVVFGALLLLAYVLG